MVPKRTDGNFSQYTPVRSAFLSSTLFNILRESYLDDRRKDPRELAYETNRDAITAYMPDDEHWIDTRTRREKE